MPYPPGMTVTVERRAAVTPADVHPLLARHLLVDGFELVLDLERSHGSQLVDARDGTTWTCSPSSPRRRSG